jgi:hypothetical protein
MEQGHPSFEVIDHTADVGIIAYGRNFRELLENAALGMFSLMAELETVEPKEQRQVTAEVPIPDKETFASALAQRVALPEGSGDVHPPQSIRHRGGRLKGYRHR